MLMTFVMSWTGIAFASNLSPSKTTLENNSISTHHSLQKNHDHHVSFQTKVNCHTSQNAMTYEHPIYQQDAIHHDCNAEHAKNSSSEESHVSCVDCSISHCQTQVCHLNVDALSYIEMHILGVLETLNSEYTASHSSDFRQDILRPPQI